MPTPPSGVARCRPLSSGAGADTGAALTFPAESSLPYLNPEGQSLVIAPIRNQSSIRID